MASSSSFRLDQLLKYAGVVESGGEAKQLIRLGSVRVNGEIETRRGRRLQPDDVVEVADRRFTAQAFLSGGEDDERNAE